MVVTFRNSVDKIIYNLAESKPAKTSFYEDLMQQRLKGSYPVVTAKWSISLTVFFGFLFVAIAAFLKDANGKVVLTRIRYDNKYNNFIDFWLPETPNPVYFYYQLNNTNRMHRMTNNGYCTTQLASTNRGASSLCESSRNGYKNRFYLCVEESPDTSMTGLFRPKYCAENAQFYAPVGSVASSMFNDTFELFYGKQRIEWIDEGIVSKRFQQFFGHPDNDTDLCNAPMFKNTAKPIGWTKHICEMGGYRNPNFMIWMQMVAYSNYKKLYKTLEPSVYPNGLRAGKYRLKFSNNYKYQRMEKYFWVLHPSWVGTKQVFLEILYLIVGCGLLFVACCLIFLQIYLSDRRRQVIDDSN